MTDDVTRTLNAAISGQTEMDTVANAPIWNGKPAIVTKKNALDASIQKIIDLDADETDPTGHKTAKDVARIVAAKAAWQMSKPMAAFATDTGDDVLRAEIDFSWSDLRYGKDETLVDNWQLVHDRAFDNKAALGAGGYIDVLLIPALQTDIDDFAAKRGKPKAAHSDIKAINIAIEAEVKVLRKIIFDLKELFVQFAVSKKLFYDAVIEAFDEDETGVRHQAIVIEYLDDDTGIRLPKVKAKLVEKAVEKLASKNGLVPFSRQEAPQGNYTVVSEMPGYLAVNTPNVVSEVGKLTRIVIRLKKI